MTGGHEEVAVREQLDRVQMKEVVGALARLAHIAVGQSDVPVRLPLPQHLAGRDLALLNGRVDQLSLAGTTH